MIKRLRKRFIRIAMLAVTAVMVLLCLIVNIANFVSVNSSLTNMLQVLGDNQGALPVPASPPDDHLGKRPDDQFTQETPYTTRYFVLRYNEDGTLVKADLDKIAAVTEDDTDTYLAIAQKHGTGMGFSSGYKYYVVDNGEGRFMAIFLDCHQEMRSVATLALLSMVAAVVCIALVYVVVCIFSRRAIDPVVQASERQKQFITDASHELKTPITVIATSLKVLEMETGQQKWIDKAMAQTEKLKELVNALVTLSRMDEEDSPLHFESFGISDAVGDTAESFRDFADSKGHTLSVAIAPGLTYNGDEYAIRQLVSILLDNAIKYATPDSLIRFALEKGKKGVVIRCANPCAPMDPADADKLFDRFYRADPSRNGQTGGFGIGLSIARSIAEGHKGSIKAQLQPDNVIEFVVTLK